jgi:hypothetical protein
MEWFGLNIFQSENRLSQTRSFKSTSKLLFHVYTLFFIRSINIVTTLWTERVCLSPFSMTPLCCIYQIPEGSQLIYKEWKKVLLLDTIPETPQIVPIILEMMGKTVGNKVSWLLMVKWKWDNHGNTYANWASGTWKNNITQERAFISI